MMDEEKSEKSPLAVAILARMKKKSPESEDYGDSVEGGSVDQEAKLAAIEDFFREGKRGNYEAAADAFKSILDACGVDYGE